MASFQPQSHLNIPQHLLDLHTLAQMNKPSVKEVIDRDNVTISRMLGRDYVFIDATYSDLSSHTSSSLLNAFESLVKSLQINKTQMAVIIVDDTSKGLHFLRCELLWSQHKINHIDFVSITDAEQKEFMEMIWSCSSSLAAA